jgi:peptidoglycan/xylan/chitin deacetylase (PgdA/CDA1 family)
MKHLFLAALCLFSLAACSHSSPKPSAESRKPSSAWNADLVLDQLLDSHDPRISARLLVERLLRIRLRAQDYLQQFDIDLVSRKEGQDIFAFPSYRRLLAARPLAEATEEKIVSLYREAREMALRISDSQEAREREGRAFLVTAGIRDALLEVRKSRAKRVLLQDLMEAMKDTFGATEAEASLRGMVEPLSAASIGPAAAEGAGEIRRLVNALPESDDIKEWIEAAAEELPGGSANVNGDERNPSAAAHFPSAGPAGNMMGFNFPKGTYALTFDDGPHGTLTLANLRSLQEQGVKATFFWIANNARRFPQIVKQVQAAGQAVANHSYMHAKILNAQDLQRLKTSPEKEVYTSTEELTQIYGFKPKYFRLPYAQGFDHPRIRAMIAEKGMIHVKWNIDSADWQDKNPVTVLARVEAQMRQNGRGIILFHDVQAGTVQAARNLMARHKGRVRWVTIPQIVDELNGR